MFDPPPKFPAWPFFYFKALVSLCQLLPWCVPIWSYTPPLSVWLPHELFFRCFFSVSIGVISSPRKNTLFVVTLITMFVLLVSRGFCSGLQNHGIFLEHQAESSCMDHFVSYSLHIGCIHKVKMPKNDCGCTGR